MGWHKKRIDFENERDILEVAKKHLDMLSFVGLTETFEQDRDIILRELGIEPPAHKVVVNATGELVTRRRFATIDTIRFR